MSIELLPMTLSTRDESGYFENGRVVRQCPSSNGSFGESSFVIEMTEIGDPSRSQMGLTAVGGQA
jgi:hypothetical protein